MFMATQAFAHGEDKLGPHGGYVRMPGAFHTEVVPEGKDQIKVYLLDINWKNPSTKNSSVEITLQKKPKAPIQCQAQNDFFICALPAGTNLQKKGKLFVTSQREEQKGNQATYDLPLKLEKPENEHNGHH